MHRNCKLSEQYHKLPSRRTRHSDFRELLVVIEVMDIGAFHRLGETGGIIVKLINRKDAQNVLQEKH